MDDIVIRPLTQDDLIQMDSPRQRDTCQGWAVDLNGKLAGIAGVAITHAMFLAFSQFTPEALAINKLTIWRTAFKLWEWMKRLGYNNLYAFADDTMPDAPGFLSRLGFTHIESSARGELFKWAS